MRRRFLAALFAFAMVGTSLWSVRGSDGEVAADEQVLRAAGVAVDGPGLLDYFRQHSLAEPDRERIRVLLKQLGDDDFDVREKASAELARQAPRAAALIRPALASDDPEVVRRVRECLAVLEPREKGLAAPAASTRRALLAAATRLVAVRKPAGAAAVLLDHLPAADGDSLVEEIERAVAAVAVRGGKLEPVLVEALTATSALRRGVAGAALARAGVGEHKDALEKLLRDDDLGVRLRVAVAFAHARNRAAVPVLIDLLGRLPPETAWRAEELLQRLAGDRSPAVMLGGDAASREKCRAAWAAWWRDHGAKVDLAALAAAPPYLGYTLVVIPDYGQVVELDRAGKPRWSLERLRSPFDAQVLPGGRVLVAQYSGLVTEHNLQGKVLWEKAVPSAMQAQRLADGSTFIVSTRTLIVFDATGKETVLYEHDRRGSSIVAARKARSGQIVAVDSDGRCTRRDAAGKELGSFNVGRISNCCLDVLPNGNVLVAKHFDGKVTEYDAAGTVVWEAKCPSAFSAVRLPTGNTLVACWQPPRVVELNRAGEAVWEQACESANHRPWFASRR